MQGRLISVLREFKFFATGQGEFLHKFRDYQASFWLCADRYPLIFLSRNGINNVAQIEFVTEVALCKEHLFCLSVLVSRREHGRTHVAACEIARLSLFNGSCLCGPLILYAVQDPK
jgi:hypothetical protein